MNGCDWPDRAVTAQTREQILRLADDYPQMWQDPHPDRERKRMARLLIEDVTLIQQPETDQRLTFDLKAEPLQPFMFPSSDGSRTRE